MSREDGTVPGPRDPWTEQQPWPGGQPAGGGEVAEREGRPPEPGEPGRTMVMPPAQAGGPARPRGPQDRPGGPGQPGPQPGKTVPRPLFWVVLSLFLVAVLAIAGLVVTRPKAGSAVALRTPAAGASSPAASSSSSPGPGSSGGSAAAASTTPSAAASPASSVAPPPSSGTSLFTQQPVQAADANVTNGAVQIGTTSYPNSIRYTCYTGVDAASTVVYDVAGFSFLNATLGVPSNATNAAGNTMSVTFFKDGSTDQLGKTLTISLDNPVALHLNLDGASQLAIDCAATQSSSDTPAAMDLALGNAVLTQP
jgi:hypothetical protein